MKRFGAVIILFALLALALPVMAGGDYGYPTTTTGPNDPCDEYHETRHPECQTTTTHQTTTTQATTTTVEETTTTQPEVTTTSFVQQTTTTAAPCAPGQIHQPPLCVDPTTTTVQTFDTTTTESVTVETLPFTGPRADLGILAIAGAAAFVLAMILLLSVRRTA